MALLLLDVINLFDFPRGARFARAWIPSARRIARLRARARRAGVPVIYVKSVVLTGYAADDCILFTAADAHMLHYRVIVPSDCVAAEQDSERRHVLAKMRKFLDARTPASSRIRLRR